MSENKIVALEIGSKVVLPELIKKDDFTTNKNYVGHTKETNIPVYLNEKLQEKEIKNIMQTEFKNLSEGNYEATVTQVYTKYGKGPDGNEDKNKEITVMELEVVGQENKQYITFFEKGYNEKQMEVSESRKNDILDRFQIKVLEDLEGQKGILTSKVNDKGYTNLYFNPKREYMNWEPLFQFSEEIKLPCSVQKFYKTQKGNQYNFIVSFVVNGKTYTDFVNYNMDLDFKKDAFNWILNKLNITLDNVDKDLTPINAILVVKKLVKGDKTYYNKRLTINK